MPVLSAAASRVLFIEFIEFNLTNEEGQLRESRRAGRARHEQVQAEVDVLVCSSPVSS